MSDSIKVLLMPSIIGSTLQLESTGLVDDNIWDLAPDGEQVLVVVRVYAWSNLRSKSCFFTLGECIAGQADSVKG